MSCVFETDEYKQEYNEEEVVFIYSKFPIDPSIHAKYTFHWDTPKVTFVGSPRLFFETLVMFRESSMKRKLLDMKQKAPDEKHATFVNYILQVISRLENGECYTALFTGISSLLPNS